MIASSRWDSAGSVVYPDLLYRTFDFNNGRILRISPYLYLKYRNFGYGEPWIWCILENPTDLSIFICRIRNLGYSGITEEIQSHHILRGYHGKTRPMDDTTLEIILNTSP